MKINVTWNTDEDEVIAGKKCAQKAVLDLVQTKIAIMCNSAKYETNNLLNGAKSILGTAPIIGCTSGKGIITPEGFISSDNGFVGMMAIGDENTTVSTAICERKINPRETGKIVAQKALEKIKAIYPPNYFMMIASPGAEEEYLKGIQDVIGDVPCFGGTASDDDLSGKWKIYNEDGVISEGVGVAFFYTDKCFESVLESGYHETIYSGVITKTNGKREISEIDGIPALKKYAEWTDKRVRTLRGIKLLEKSVLKPWAVKTHNGQAIVIKQLLNGNTNFGINVANDIGENMAVVQMTIEKHEIISAPAITIRKIKDEQIDKGYLVFQNINRENIVHKEIEKMCEKLKRELYNIPYMIICSNGEFGKTEHSANMCTALSISATAFKNDIKKLY